MNNQGKLFGDIVEQGVIVEERVVNNEPVYDGNVYFKVVLQDSGGLYSACTFNHLRVEYKVNEWVHGRYPLFLFKTYRDALGFAMSGDEIYVCRAKGVKEINFLLANFADSTLEKCDNYWSGEWNDLILGPPLEGTLVADEVKLIAVADFGD